MGHNGGARGFFAEVQYSFMEANSASFSILKQARGGGDTLTQQRQRVSTYSEAA